MRREDMRREGILSVNALYSSMICSMAEMRSAVVRLRSTTSNSILPSQYRSARSIPEAISSATMLTKSALPFDFAQDARLYVVRGLLLVWRSRLSVVLPTLVLHVLLHSLLVLGNHVRHLRFLV